MTGEFDEALGHHRSALRRFRRLGDDTAAAWVLNNMGMAHVDLAQWSNAERAFDEAFDLADRHQDTHRAESCRVGSEARAARGGA
jgi:tetratricopeptide (TPR) repeat protein